MKTTVVTKIDDLTEKPFDEGETITFAVQGKSFEIDLSKRNATQFYRSLDKYMAKGRRVRNPGRVHKGRDAHIRHEPDQVAKVRAWARQNGHDVADRGRVPEAIWAEYRSANATDA